MGSPFRYIADDALVSSPGSVCNICTQEGVTTFPYSCGEWEPSPGEEVVVEELCATCLQRGDIRWCNEWKLAAAFGSSFTRVAGARTDLLEAQRSMTYWKHGLGQRARDFAADGPPEDFDEVSRFRCLHCERRYWIDQYT